MALTDITRPSDVALNTDLYELTMAQGYWESGFVNGEGCFNVFFRDPPFKGGYGIAGGIGQYMYVDEKLFNAWTGFATSAPLMIYKFIYGMIEGGIYSGFSLEQSKQIVYENIIGTGLNLQLTGEHPLQLVDKLTTPGGVGIEHFKALEEGNFTNLCVDAVWAAVQKAESMAEKYKVE